MFSETHETILECFEIVSDGKRIERKLKETHKRNEASNQICMFDSNLYSKSMRATPIAGIETRFKLKTEIPKEIYVILNVREMAFMRRWESRVCERRKLVYITGTYVGRNYKNLKI